MEKSQSTTNLIKSLVKAQSEFSEVKKNKFNSHLKYHYADLDSMKNATMPALKNNGITLNFFPTTVDGVNYIQALLSHESGEFILSRYKVEPEKPGMQATGAAFTYLKKYIWGAIFSLYDDENDDAIEEIPEEKRAEGNSFSYAEKKESQKQQPTTPIELISTEEAQTIVKECYELPDLFKQILSSNQIKDIRALPKAKYANVMGWVKQVRSNRVAK